MLAEKKSRLKWSQDPRNCHWSKDRTKYGYRMLEKMGWKEGKGLGMKEDGDTQHIKISKKQDNAGVGSKRSRDEGWIEHQDAFDKILADLHTAQGGKETEQGPKETKSLVRNAVEAKKIVYKRFLQSKDLSAQSSEDLDCVLGRKRRKTKTQTSVKADEVTEATEEQGLATSHGVTTVTNTQSVQEYFSSKMAARGAPLGSSESVGKAARTAHSKHTENSKKKRTSKT